MSVHTCPECGCDVPVEERWVAAHDAQGVQCSGSYARLDETSAKGPSSPYLPWESERDADGSCLYLWSHGYPQPCTQQPGHAGACLYNGGQHAHSRLDQPCNERCIDAAQRDRYPTEEG